MKTSITVVLVTLGISFFSFTSHAENALETYNLEKVVTIDNQDETVQGIYKGYDESGYNFSIVDSNGNESVITFQKIDEAVARANDLTTESAIGKTFEITFEVTSEEALDSNGDEITQETKIIKALKASR